MPSIEDRLTKIEMRQEATIQAIHKHMDATEAGNELLRRLLEWANRPPSNDLAETMKSVLFAMRSINEQMTVLPDQVAQAVVTAIR